MRTRKYLALALLAAIGMEAQAQIVTSESRQIVVTEQPKPVKEKKPKKPRTFIWTARAGYSIDNMTGQSGIKSVPGFDAGLGITKFYDSGWFWGVEAGALTYGAKVDDGAHTYAIHLSPRFGYAIPMSGSLTLAPYIGPYAGVTFSDDTDTRSYYRYDYQANESWEEIALHTGAFHTGVNVGADLIVGKNFFFNVHVRKDFVSEDYRNVEYRGNDYYDSHYEESDIYGLKIVLGVGVNF